MPTKIVVSGGLLIINDSFSIRTDGFTVKITDGKVVVKSTYDNSSVTLSHTDANVAGTTSFANALALMMAISALSTSSGGGGSSEPITITSGDITDASTVGKQVLVASNAAAARSAIGAGTGNGTSNLDLGTTAGTAVDAGAYNTAMAAKAPLASPTFTGDPKAPTPVLGDNDTSVATTAFVLSNAGKNKTQISALVSPTADYADLTAVTAALKNVIDALKA